MWQRSTRDTSIRDRPRTSGWPHMARSRSAAASRSVGTCATDSPQVPRKVRPLQPPDRGLSCRRVVRPVPIPTRSSPPESSPVPRTRKTETPVQVEAILRLHSPRTLRPNEPHSDAHGTRVGAVRRTTHAYTRRCRKPAEQIHGGPALGTSSTLHTASVASIQGSHTSIHRRRGERTGSIDTADH